MATLRRLLFAAALILAFSPAVAPAAAPKSATPLSNTDALWVRSALKAAEQSKWESAATYAGRVEDPLAAKFLLWRRLIDAPDGTTFDEIKAFLRENPDWPRHRRLLRHAERLMPFDLAPEDTIAWFTNREPQSAEGYMRLGAAFMASDDPDIRETGRALIRDAWIEGNFTRADERDLYRRFQKQLTKDDHIQRLDRLLWDGKTSAARRMIYKVPEPWRLLAQARFSLRRRAGNVDYLISKVPGYLRNHPGLVYERLRWRRRKGLDSAAELLKGLPAELPRPELWWREKASIARSVLRKGHISEAYEIAANHRLDPGGAAYADAEWLAGWIALRFLKDYDVALAHFERLHDAVNYPISVSRAAYWAGRAAEAKGDDEKAVTWYRAGAEHPFSYYGQLAFARLRPGKALALPAPITAEARAAEAEAFKQHELVQVVRLLNAAGERSLMRPFLQNIFDYSDEPGWQSLTAWLARGAGRPDLAVRIAKLAGRDGVSLLEVAYPTLELPAVPKTADAPAPEPPLTLAVIRQESAFRIDARSHANARGLMQIIPPTAKRVSHQLKLRYSRIKLMTDPTYNMTLGQSYLGGLIQDFKGSYVLALAAYNAGPHRVVRWLKAHGDPRDSEVDAIDWVEMIPFTETRNYVQRVLENLQVYRLRLAETEVALGLADDLHIDEN